ncbi:MAG: HD domain-containing protein [Ruminococcaceae bacterium]|nr:HD domain-containing protein [Oscillospiraceae bacterium]
MKNVPGYVAEILSALEAAGYEAWCVGGCVRDSLLGREPEDWDVTTSALPEETMAVFAPHAIPTGLQHGTVTVRSDHKNVEVTTYRVDGEYRDHRRPESVVFTRSLEEDLARRDFTINAMAENARGELRDPFGGAEDLRRGLLRCVGEPDRRFAEDALRILRGLRFAAVLGLEIETETAASIHRNRELLRQIAAERIQVELMKLLRGKDAGRILRQYPDVVGVFWPEVLPMVGFAQKNHHHCFDVWEHSIHALEMVKKDDALLWSALLHDIGKPECFTVDGAGVGHFYGHAQISRDLADTMLRRLKCSTEFRETVVRLVEWHDREIPRTDKGVRRALRLLGEKDLRRLIVLKRADNLAQAPEYHNRQLDLDEGEAILEKLLAEDACFSLKQLAVNGRDLLALGLRGAEIGRVLDALLDAVVNGEVPNEREALLGHLRTL